MDNSFVKIKDIANATNLTKRAIQKRAVKEKWKAVIVNKCGEKEFVKVSLPREILMALMKKDNAPLSYELGMPMPIAVGDPELTTWQNKQALAWTDLLRLYVEVKEEARAEKESVVKVGKTFFEGYNTGRLFPEIFSIIGKTSFSTAEAKLKKLKEAGNDYVAIAYKWGQRRGHSKVTEDEFNVSLSFALHPNRLKIEQVIRMTKLSLKKRDILSPSSGRTISRALKEWKDTHYDKWVFCREGEKALNDKCLPYIERDINVLDVGEVLVADGHVLNFQCLNPYTGKPCRANMLMWYDWASCYPVGWEIMPTENVQVVAAGLRKAILKLGKMPKVAYLDNGRAFKAKIFTSKDIDFEAAGFSGMFARLGIETTFAWPYNAQSKIVERFFGTFNELERLMPTYTGLSIADKPPYMLRNEKLHKKIHEKKYGGWVPTIAEANYIISGWVDEYAQRPHGGLKGLCPGDILEAGQGPGIDEDELRFMMMSMENKQVRRNGIRFMGRNYYHDALYEYNKRVLIRYDLEDMSKIYVFDKIGARLICAADVVEPVHPMAKITGQKEDMALVKRGIEHKKHLKKETEQEAREYIQEVPSLIQMPEKQAYNVETGNKKGKVLSFTKAEEEKIKADVAKMECSEIKPVVEDPIYMSEPDRYEAYLEAECKGEELALDSMQFMRYFEKTSTFRLLKERFEFLQELWILETEEESTEDESTGEK